MNHYIDITVLPDPEFKATILMNALYAKCHRVLGKMAKGNVGNSVGVSFPQHKSTLGEVLRLHGSQEQLQAIVAEPWLKGLRDYTLLSEVQEVPITVQYRTVARIDSKSPEKKRRRSISKGWLTPEQAAERIPDTEAHIHKLPFAQLISLSNKNPYKVFVKHGELLMKPVVGHFSSLGLSKTATVPWF